MISLKAETREILGKSVRVLRRRGLVPAELYGEGENKHLTVLAEEIRKAYQAAGSNTLIELVINDGSDKLPVLIADISEDPIRDEILSVDFRKISLTERLKVSVPVRLIGESPASKDGAVVTQVLQEVEVECLPTNMPHEFEVSLDKLSKAGDQITVRDIVMHKDVEMITSPDSVVVIAAEHDEESFETPETPETVVVESKGEEKEAATEEGAAS